jgi:beta-mannosidase
MSREIVSLSGEGWRLGRAPAGAGLDDAAWDEQERVARWLPATVPGDVRADLVRAGHLPDPYVGQQAAAGRWVDDHCWWLVRDWHQTRAPGERVHLIIRGLDYLGDIYLNGRHLARHEGMFAPQHYDVGGLLVAENRLAVRLAGARWLPQDRSTALEKLLNRVEARAGSLSPAFPDRRDTLKCQMGFGWDFAPVLPGLGLWDDVYLTGSGNPCIHDVVVRTTLAQHVAILDVEVALDTHAGPPAAGRVRLACTLAPETFAGPVHHAEETVALSPGTVRRRVAMRISAPRLWWAWDQGRPDLYRLSVRVEDEAGTLDIHEQTVGLRQIELDGWTLHVNGRPVYCRGANWVPAGIFPGTVRRDDYRTLLELARAANMNTVRVWGGGLREKPAFYDACDHLGILVWQEFPFACAFLTRFPRATGYLRLVEAEARGIVRDVGSHPSLAVWCGGNEFDPGRNAPLVDTLHRAVEAEDGTRPFLPASPAGGDSHDWSVWHHFEPPAAYRRTHPGFASEFGLQAPPGVQALRRFLPPDELWPPGASWAFHGANIDKLWRYARPFLPRGEEVTLESFVAASQRAQAEGLRIAVEHYRRLKAQGNGGALVWQLNEPWPAISWALLDHDRSPKPAYDTVRRAFQPLLASVDYPLRCYRPGDELPLRVWVIHDGAEPLPGSRVLVRLLDAAGREAERVEAKVDVAPASATPVAGARWILPSGGGWRLVACIEHGSIVVSENEYDLAACDDLGPTPRQRLWAWLTGLVTPG